MSRVPLKWMREGLDDFTAASCLDPKHVVAYKFRAVRYNQYDQFLNALQNSEMVLNLAPTTTNAYCIGANWGRSSRICSPSSRVPGRGEREARAPGNTRWSDSYSARCTLDRCLVQRASVKYRRPFSRLSPPSVWVIFLTKKRIVPLLGSLTSLVFFMEGTLQWR